MYDWEKERVYKIIVILGGIVVTLLFAWLFAGCAGKPTVIDTNEVIIGSMDSLRQLRDINRRSNEIIADYNRFIAEQSERLRTGAIDVRTALTEYDNFVLKLIERISELEKLSRTVDAQVLQGIDPADNSIGSLRNLLSRENFYDSVVLQENSGS